MARRGAVSDPTRDGIGRAGLGGPPSPCESGINTAGGPSSEGGGVNPFSEKEIAYAAAALPAAAAAAALAAAAAAAGGTRVESVAAVAARGVRSFLAFNPASVSEAVVFTVALT